MKFFLLGANGRTGKLVIEQGLSRGHEMTAVLRRPGALQARDRLCIVPGDPLRPDDLASNVANHDAVISCLGQRSGQDADLLRDAAAATLEAMKRTGVRRYLVISQGLLFSTWNPVVTLLRLILARHVADSTAMERLVRASDTEWTIVRPPRLREGGAPRGYRINVGSSPKGRWTLQYADLAAFLVDEAEKQQYPKAVVGLAAA